MNLALFVVLTCQLLLIGSAITLIWSWLTQTPFYPSSVKKLDQLIKEGTVVLPKEGKFIDIGSGDGRIVAWASQLGYEAHGVEFNPYLSLLSRLRIFLTRFKKNKTEIFNKNFKKHDYTDYSVAYIYIFSDHMNEIKEKLFREMKPGSVIISNTFKFKDIEPDEVHGRYNIYRVK
jgi:hypothetical protein